MSTTAQEVHWLTNSSARKKNLPDHGPHRTRSRTKTKPNGTEANEPGRNTRACVVHESKRKESWGVDGRGVRDGQLGREQEQRRKALASGGVISDVGSLSLYPFIPPRGFLWHHATLLCRWLIPPAPLFLSFLRAQGPYSRLRLESRGGV